MASRKRRKPDGPRSDTSVEDEADILAEAGAERDEETGELVISEAKFRELGAVDASSVRENRRIQDIASRRKAGEKGIIFNADDILTQYEGIIKAWPPNTIDISLKRLTGSPIEKVIMTRPRSGAELYTELMAIHGQYEEAKYHVKFFDSAARQFRGNGHITLPDTRTQSQGGHPMSGPQYPFGAQPGGYPPGYGQPSYPYPQQPWQQPQQPWQPQQPNPASQPQSPAQTAPPDQTQQNSSQQPPQQSTQHQPPQVHFMPPQSPDPVQMMQQMFSMFTEMRNSLQQQQPPQQPPSPPQMPAPPPPHASPDVMMDWMRQMFSMFQQMQPAAPATSSTEHQHPQQPSWNPMEMMQLMMSQMNPMMGASPPIKPPPGTMWVPGLGLAPIDRLVQVFAPDEAPRGPRPPYRPPYGSHGEEPRRYPPPPSAAPTAPPKTPAESFQEAISMARTTMDAVKSLHDLFPQTTAAQQPQTITAAADTENDDSPVRVVDMGPAKGVFDKKTGDLRPWETLFSNSEGIFSWIAEQREEIQKGRQHQEAPKKQLPSGYMEVTEGFKPPPGMRAEIVNPDDVPWEDVVEQPQQQPQSVETPHQPRGSGLVSPPQHMPPPVQPTQADDRAWEMPSIPTEGDG